MDLESTTRAISSAGYNAHTEPLFKFYNILKVEDIPLVLYYNLKHNIVPDYITSFIPNTSSATEPYPIRQSRYQPPFVPMNIFLKLANIVFLYFSIP